MKVFLTPFDESKSVLAQKNYVVDNFIGKNKNIGYSVVRTHLDGTHPTMKNIRSNRTYYFLSGEAVFKTEDGEFKVKSGEMLTILANTKFSFSGKFDAILIDCPAFDPKDDVIFE